MSKPLNFILISRSGGGKGTQAEFIKKEFNDLYHFSTGDLLRDLQKQDTDTGYRIREILSKGGLPFDFIAITLWMHKIAYNLKRGQGLLADGFPRRLNEAKILDEFLDFLERKENTKIIYIDISEKEAFERLTKRRICKKCKKLVPYVLPYKNWEKCGECGGELEQRSDDKPEAIQGRMDYFRERVLEVLDYYRGQNRLIEVNGEQRIEDVWRDIKKSIK